MTTPEKHPDGPAGDRTNSANKDESYTTDSGTTSSKTPTTKHAIDREIARLALPSLGSLLAEPLLVATDTVMVGHLGTGPLAGLALASTILTTLVGLCIFLAYATTSATARYVGAGRMKAALSQGMDGLWLAGTLGVLLGAILAIWAPQILAVFGAEGIVITEGARYLRFSAAGLPGMLVVLAATGTLRGLGNTTTPFKVSVLGALVNIPLNFVFIYPAGLGLAGAGIGTAAAQTVMGVVLTGVVVHHAREHHAPLAPRGVGVLRALHDSVPLIVRSAVLRVLILLQITGATQLGTEALAANQITMTIWNFASYGLDALAMAAQILVGQASGAGDESRLRVVLGRCLSRGMSVGAVLGAATVLTSPLIVRIMSTAGDVRWLAFWGLLVIAVFFPIASVAFILDGVLIGAGDLTTLAWMMFIPLALYGPMVLALLEWTSGQPGFIWLWIGYAGVCMSARALPMYLRVRGEKWVQLGSSS
ncbi:MAG: MATE family efflux transporter [Actinotignum sanguinis]|uniref:MATE family efflux transporter n=1 Tax=Actinotignum sanguinis TaxID=1445614 RepID=UPI00237ED344|nr:MATE family efflux transporter [Actinotignum sanguinis]MDE1564899.1 MATE family efflux transporter [Actinotignum sanguinis]MDE1576642.1 MATE family efflux transporter [Actinotignum sanguinis]MDE1641461.1 MATE family efflux transporter [Actinotignum sanguinis]MDK8286879.1 MATE family efflux transporter [Actinotignum sanguinis]MDK8353579.1 MATE family efflux transporter [Actinotignum sanguinis]